MTNPILTKLFSLGLSAAIGGAGLFAGSQMASSLIAAPEAPVSVSVANGAIPEALLAEPRLASALSSVDPSVLADPQIARTLNDPTVIQVLRDPAVLDAISGIDPAVLTRPAVLDAIQRRQITPAVMADPVVMANLPQIMAAVPTLQAAFERLENAPSLPSEPLVLVVDDQAAAGAELGVEERLPAPSTDPVVMTVTTTQESAPVAAASEEDCGDDHDRGDRDPGDDDDDREGEARSRGRSELAHARSAERRSIRAEVRDARRAQLDARPAPGRAPRGVSAEQRAEIEALRGTARTALSQLVGLGLSIASGS